VDFAILRGDPSDGLPGVPGVGEKTARTLVNGSPSLSALLDAANRQTPRLALSLRQARAYVEAMQRVVPVRTDVEVTVLAGTRDDARLERLAGERALDSPVERLRAALDRAAAAR
jgi:5'-3' exonuclease